MTIQNKLTELKTYEEALKEYYPLLTEEARVKIAVSLIKLYTKEQVQNYLATNEDMQEV